MMFFNIQPITINNSKDSEYHSQRNNEIYPLEVCGPTSMAMGLVQAGYTYWQKEGKDSADVIAQRLLKKDAYDKMYSMLRTKDTMWKPFNLHTILTWGVNDLVGGEVSVFKTDWSLQEILFNVLHGGGAVMPGDFTLSSGRELGHIISLAGFVTTQQNIKEVRSYEDININKIKTFIIDDPYGNYLTDYKEHKGNNVYFDTKTFNQVFRPNNVYKTKWAHLIKPLEV